MMARTSAMVSMMLAPTRFLISSVTAGWPPTRAKPSGSLKPRRTVATSANVTTRSPSTLSGIASTSSNDSTTPGTLTTSRPAPVSIAPGATSRLLLRIRVNSSV